MHIGRISGISVGIALLVSILPLLSEAQGIDDDGRLGLLRAQDLAPFGEVLISTPPMKPPPSEYPDAAGLQEALSVAFSVEGPPTSGYRALVLNEVLEFRSPKDAQRFMVSKQQEALQEVKAGQTTPIDLNEMPKSTFSQKGVAANALYRVDEDGIVNVVLILQRRTFVAGVRMMIYASDVDQLTERVREGATLAELANPAKAITVGLEMIVHISTVILAAPPSSREDRLSPRLVPDWYGTCAASFWRHLTEQGQTCPAWSPAGNCHHLATWTRPYGNNPHYTGSGGDSATCASSHGCISQWTWWLRTPESRLGVPKSFYFIGIGPMTISNYIASVWYD